MKYFIVLIFFASLLFGVKPVPRNNGDKDDDKKTEKVIKTTNKTERKEKDLFIDKDANGVNDQREKDLQKIKQTNSKHKELLKKNNSKKSSNTEKAKEAKPAKKKTTKKSTSK